MLPSAVVDFVETFRCFPGVGARTAERFAFFLLSEPPDVVAKVSEVALKLRREVGYCSICGALADAATQVCSVCQDGTRRQDLLCVVEEAVDVHVIEQTGVFYGLYHVLGGVISPIDGITADNLRIDSLVQRVTAAPFAEVILAMGSTTEGDTTALYLKEELKGKVAKLSYLARGMSVGTRIEYVAHTSLIQAMKRRESIDS